MVPEANSQSAEMSFVEPLLAAFSQCDACSSYAQLCKALEVTVSPVFDGILRSPLQKPISDYGSVDESCPEAARVREALTEGDRITDDVWYFVFVVVNRLLEKHTRKRARGTEVGGNIKTVIANAFTLFCNRRLSNLDELTIRWAFLKREKKAFESSDAYVHANASERRKMQMHSVLSVFSERAHRHVFTSLWLQCVNFSAEAALHAHLLYRLGTIIIPSLNNPLVMADYLSGCFRSGGLVSILSLQGIFILMLDHGLEYPKYFQQLYSLITADAFASRHRYDLFRLLDLSMTSLRVPSYIVASVIKRTARVCLSAPSPTLYFGLPFIRKLLQAHPNCLALIHRKTKEAIAPEEEELLELLPGSTEEEKGERLANAKLEAARHTAMLFNGIDPYLPEKDPEFSQAMCSTLWEFTALEKHFLPIVPLMINSFSSTAEDKSALKFEKSFGRLFTAEVTRRIPEGTVPPVAYREPEGFRETDLIDL